MRKTSAAMVFIKEYLRIVERVHLISSTLHLDKGYEEIMEMIKDETITEGMIPKINACLDAVNNGVTAVGIINGTKPHSCLWEIFSDKGSGTLIRQ